MRRIDTVGEIGDALAGAGANFFVSLLDLVGLDEVTDAGEVTVFVPNDDPFASLDADQLAALIDDPDQVLDILRAHVVEGVVTSETCRMVTRSRPCPVTNCRWSSSATRSRWRCDNAARGPHVRRWRRAHHRRRAAADRVLSAVPLQRR